MKKQNNRFRNSNGNNNGGYTLNYKFDSVSIAGKISGTALDLIRRYNDLAKEAQGCGNYVDMEVYRQYAEHYRKIVTEINERRQAKNENQQRSEDQGSVEVVVANTNEEGETTQDVVEEKTTVPVEPVAEANGYVETLPASAAETAVKSFQVVEIQEESQPIAKPKRVVRKRTTVQSRKKAVEEVTA